MTNIRIMLLVTSTLLVLMLTFAGAVSADNGPHGSFGALDTTSTTDSCAGCHRAHTGTADTLLRWGPTEYDFCTQCHGPIGQGAVTNVVDGVIQGVSGPGSIYPDANASVTSKQISTGDPLNGGGFENMRLYIPATDYTTAWASTTSKHRVDGLPGAPLTPIAWGGGDNDNGPGIGGTLKCTSCHNPHGSPNYRILGPGYKNGVANATSWTSQAATWSAVYQPVLGIEPVVGSNEILAGAHNYASKLNVYYDYGISDFCGGCHQEYLLNRANGLDMYNAYNAGDGQTVTRFRHAVSSKGYYSSGTQQWSTGAGPYRTDAAAFAPPYPLDTSGRALRRVTVPFGGSRNWTTLVAAPDANYNGTLVTCLTCHYAHGSAAKATAWAAGVAPTNDSANLYLDNRGVCQGCHGKGGDPESY